MIDESVLIKEIKQEADTRFAGLDSCVSFEEMILWIEQQPKIGGWIPCSERLPEEDGKYICTQKIYSMSNGKLIGRSVENVDFFDGEWMREAHLKVIAWQPVPEVYHG